MKVPEYKDEELFAVFRDFDENEKGFLEIKDYADCLAKFTPLELNARERIFIALVLDMKRNGMIDYESGMNWFYTVLVYLKRHSELQQMYMDEVSFERPLGSTSNVITPGVSAAAAASAM